MGVRREESLEINQVWSDDGMDYKAARIVIDTQGDGPGSGSRAIEIVVDDVVVFAIDKAGNITKGGVNQAPVTDGNATLALTAALHGGRPVVLTKTNGQAVTLPAATGSGVKFEIVIGADVASSATTIKVTGDDTMKGTAYGDDGDGEPANGWPTAADSDTISMDGSTTGGKAGDRWIIQDIAADKWAVLGFLTQGGSEATPFSATVT